MSDEPENVDPASDAPEERAPEERAPEERAPEERAAEERAPAAEGAEAKDPEVAAIEEKVVEVLRTVYDPEIPVDIYELGLIYEVAFDKDPKHVRIRMTLTSPSCPVAGTLPGEVETRVKEVEGVDDVTVDLVWDPPWSMERLSEAARLQMGLT